jgi:NAD+ synthase (glutamine-hydrolysing)
MNYGYFRVAAAVPKVNVANPLANAANIIETVELLDKEKVGAIVMPEMCITGYTCGDLFHNAKLLDDANKALALILSKTANCNAAFIVGMPVVVEGSVYNCAVAIHGGEILGVVPKSYIPNYNEFYEKRWWRSGADMPTQIINIAEQEVVFGVKQLFDVDGVKLGIEICEDLWTPIPPSCATTLAGADIIFNLSASDALIGKYDYLTSLVKQQSARCMCGYVYASAGYGESSTDLVFDGIGMIAENGAMLTQTERWSGDAKHVIADIDICAIRRDRMHFMSFADCRHSTKDADRYTITTSDREIDCDNRTLRRHISRTPFVPAENDDINKRSSEIINIQVAALARRLDFTHCKSLVVGISGGLDSTLALLVAVRAFDRLHLDRKGITGVTMPGYGTTGRTYNNAINLMKALGVTIRDISIVPAVEQHFSDIGHDATVHDVTYENAQARQRTYLLMDIANQTNGMVLGTGDLSELALGWATYNGDHMSMYGVNAGVPKTLVKYLVRWFAQNDDSVSVLLYDIIDTPISPELIPAQPDGTIKQKTEDLVGPYELHDFFLYYTLRYGYTPKHVYFIAQHTFKGAYDADTIKHWMKTFYRRFFNQQFKRSCMPDGPKVGSVCLSPRGDWRMPSDAESAAWLNECENL